jgi:hypothetical protein
MEDASRFYLDDAIFTAWWEALAPEDRDEFTHVYGGTRAQARFVCALDYLRSVARRDPKDDLILRAHAYAQNLDYEGIRRDFNARSRSQATYESPAVERLMEMLRYRSRRNAEERIFARTQRKLEQWYDRADEMLNLRKEGLVIDDAALFRIENAAVTQSNQFLARASKERVAHENRKEREAADAAIALGRARESDALRPPTPEQARSYLAMLAEQLGPEEFAQIAASVTPLSLPSGE